MLIKKIKLQTALMFFVSIAEMKANTLTCLLLMVICISLKARHTTVLSSSHFHLSNFESFQTMCAKKVCKMCVQSSSTCEVKLFLCLLLFCSSLCLLVDTSFKRTKSFLTFHLLILSFSVALCSFESEFYFSIIFYLFMLEEDEGTRKV